jgi:predicted Fe-Mo cluster-binding NifX family protein
MKIAIACREGRISPVFDVSDMICLVEIKDRKEQRRWNITLLNHNPFDRAKEVSSIGAKVLICGAVSRVLQIALAGVGIEVIGFICGDLESVLDAFLRGQLMNGHFSMPGCFGQQQRLHFRQRRGKR